jgi:predicted deacylase
MPDKPEIKNVALSADAAGPHLLITGGVHGDEFEPMAAIRQLIGRCRAIDADIRLCRGSLTLVPVVNEAAFLRGARIAEDGLDLARVCPGDPAGSVTQRTAHALSEMIRAADYYIDLHSGGTQFSVLPMTGYTLHSDAQVLDQQRNMARAFNLPIAWGTANNLEGRSLSVARDANVPAIYAEYLGSGLCNVEGVGAYVNGCLNVMRLLKMIDGAVSPCRVELAVEDPRPDSGHMQVCNPAPVTGFFEPAVKLGQHVDSGARLGTVSDATTTHEIRSQQTGIVLVLRTFSRVMKGESVGVVLETAKIPAGIASR